MARTRWGSRLVVRESPPGTGVSARRGLTAAGRDVRGRVERCFPSGSSPRPLSPCCFAVCFARRRLCFGVRSGRGSTALGQRAGCLRGRSPVGLWSLGGQLHTERVSEVRARRAQTAADARPAASSVPRQQQRRSAPVSAAGSERLGPGAASRSGLACFRGSRRGPPRAPPPTPYDTWGARGPEVGEATVTLSKCVCMCWVACVVCVSVLSMSMLRVFVFGISVSVGCMCVLGVFVRVSGVCEWCVCT